MRAVSLDRSLAEAYAILGAVRRDFDWDWEGAEDAFRRALELDTGDAFSHAQFGIYRKFFPPGADHVQDSWLMAQMIAQAGRREAEKLVNTWRYRSGREYVDPYNIASIYAALGKDAETIAWLDKAYRERSPSIKFLKVEPWFQSLRHDPRYKEILVATNFPQ